LRNRLLYPGFFLIPGVFNPFVALQVAQKGFKAAYLSGAALSSSKGVPDIGLLTIDNVEDTVREIKAAVDIPLIVDIDTGFGEAISVYNATKRLEKAGADAVQIEDQRNPKRCGHLEGKEVVEPEHMIEKIRAAIRARRNTLVIARTDARAVKDLDDAIARGNAYKRAGADIIFPEALLSAIEFAKFAKAVKAPLLANMTEFGKTPIIKAEEFHKMGYKYVIFPVTPFRAAAKAMSDALDTLKRTGTQKIMLKRLLTRSEQYRIIKYDSFTKLDRELKRESKTRV
jgi:methylisocitrate lyase